MILNFHGASTDITSLRQQAGLGARGVNLKSIAALASTLGMQTRALALEMSEIEDVQLPSIAHVEGNHFVVLERVNANRVVVVDPASGRRTISMKRFAETFTGVILECMPPDRVPIQVKANTSSWFKLMGAVRGIRSSLVAITVMALVLEVGVLLVPLFVQAVVDTVVVNRDYQLLVALAGAYALVVVMQVVIGAFRGWAVTVLSSGLTLGWTANVFRHLMILGDQYFSNRSLGDISSRFGSINVIQNTLTSASVEAALDGLMASLTLAMLFIYSAELGWLVVAGTLLYVAIRVLALRVLMESNIDLINASAKQETYFLESLRIMDLLRLTNAQASRSSSFIDVVTDVQRKTVRLSSIMLVFASIGTLVYSFLKLSVLIAGARAVIEGVFSAGMLIAFIAYVEQFTGRTTKLIDFAVQFKLLKVQTDRVRDIVATAPEVGLTGSYKGPIDDGSIVARGLYFSYGAGSPWILHNAHLEVRDGEFVGIVGASGQGKTTLIKLFVGLLDPVSGTLSLGGVNMEVLGKSRVREHCAVVQQHDVLLSGSILQNIAGFSEAPNLELAQEMAKIAAVHDEIMAMPMRYETRVGDLGALVSGGQRQRICLARALYRCPKVLMLDEATSHVDPEMDFRIAEALNTLALTRIVISHRPSTLRCANRILMIESGELRPFEQRRETAMA
jgi:ATP-binding cassette subfamily B protein RaxB